jgi:hypothetical protein
VLNKHSYFFDPIMEINGIKYLLNPYTGNMNGLKNLSNTSKEVLKYVDSNSKNNFGVY